MRFSRVLVLLFLPVVVAALLPAADPLVGPAAANHHEPDRAPNLRLAKSCPGQGAPGAEVTYTLDFANPGTAAARQVTITDILDPGLAYHAGSSQRDGHPIPDPTIQPGGGDGATTLVFDLGDLPQGSSGTLTYGVGIPAQLDAESGRYTNTASIATTSTEPDTSDNTSSCSISVASTPDLSIAKACPPSASRGEQLTHTLAYANNGTGPATGVRIVDVLGDGLDYIQGSARSGGEPIGVLQSEDGRTLTFDLGSVAAGTGGTIDYEVAVTTSGQVASRAVISAEQDDPNPGDNVAECTTGAPFVDVFVAKSCAGTAEPGATLTHMLRYGNQGSGQALDVQVVDVLDAGLTYVAGSATRDGGPVTPQIQPDAPSAGQTTLTFDLGTLDAGETGTLSYEVSVPATADEAGPRSFASQATIGSSSGDVNAGNDATQGCSTVVEYRPILQVRKSGCPHTAVPGGVLTYTITFRNVGSSTARHAALVDSLPADTAVADARGGQVARNGRSVRWDLGDLAPGASGSRTLDLRVAPQGHPVLVNRVTLTASDAEPATAETSTIVSEALAVASGLAFGLDVRAGGTDILSSAGQVASSAPGGPGADAQVLAPLSLPGVVDAKIVSTASTSAITGQATSSGFATVADLDLLAGAITAKAVHAVSQSVSDAGGASYGSVGASFTDLRINGTPYANVAPNTRVAVLNPLDPAEVLAEAHLYEETGGSEAAPGAAASARHSVNMIRVVLLQPFLELPAGAVITVSHAGTSSTYPSGQGCGASPSMVSGKAFTASVGGQVLGSPTLSEQTGAALLPATGGANSDTTAVDVAADGTTVVSNATAANETEGTLTPFPKARSRSLVEQVRLLDGLITATALDVAVASQATATDAGTAFDVTFLDLKVQTEIATARIAAKVKPNTTLAVPRPDGSLLFIILNEQTSGGNGTSAAWGTVNAIHAFVLRDQRVEAEIVVASAHAGAQRG